MRAITFVLSFAALCAAESTLYGELLTITSTPQANTGSFRHNVFHSATRNGNTARSKPGLT